MQIDSSTERAAPCPSPVTEIEVSFAGTARAERMRRRYRPDTARPTALMIGAAPPPYNGSIMMFWTLMTSSLKDHFRLVHLDISDHRGLENIARLDFRNVYLALRHSLDCILALRQERPDIVYVPIA